jgi:UTP--glucose-1-phosphate uridylyltransferase
MRTTKAVITAAGRDQRTIPLQTLIDRDSLQKSLLAILVEEALRAGIEEVCVVVCPGDEAPYRDAVGEHASRVHFVPQAEPLGYGHALYCAHDFIGDEPFLHMVGDHVYVSRGKSCAQQLLDVARAQSCSVSGVQPTRENLLTRFGTVGGHRLPGARDLFVVERVMEKPTPTEAEQTLMVPGLRAGHYLCVLGMHVLTPLAMQLLAQRVEKQTGGGMVELSPVLNELAARERYLALEAQARRYPVDVRYGLLLAQVGLALYGQDREEVLAALCEILAQYELDRTVA